MRDVPRFRMRVRQLHFGPDQEFEPGRVVAALALRAAAAAPTPQKPPQSGTPHAADADSRTTPLPPAERPVYNPPRPPPTALRKQNPVPNPPSPTAHWLAADQPLRQQVAPGAGAVILNPGRAGTPGGPAAHAKSPGHCLREALQGGTEAGGGVVLGVDAGSCRPTAIALSSKTRLNAKSVGTTFSAKTLIQFGQSCARVRAGGHS